MILVEGALLGKMKGGRPKEGSSYEPFHQIKLMNGCLLPFVCFGIHLLSLAELVFWFWLLKYERKSEFLIQGYWELKIDVENLN